MNEVGRTNVDSCSFSPVEENLSVQIGDEFYMHSLTICIDDREALQKMEGVLQIEDDQVVNALEHALVDN